MKMRVLWAVGSLGLTLLFGTCVQANDSAISGVSGTPGNLKAVQLTGEHKSVRMVREEIVMTIGRNDYVTDAHFVFRNDGPATTVRMGFPESSGGDSNFEELKTKTPFREFETWVDGRKVVAWRMIAESNPDDFEFEAFWVKSVPFKRGQTRNVRVRYRSPLGTSTADSFVAYSFTGGNWKGKVDESVLLLKFQIPGTYLLLPVDDRLGNYTRTNKRNAIEFRWRNWQAQADFSFRYLRTLPGTLMRAWTVEELGQDSSTYPQVETKVIRGSGKFDPWQADVAWPPSVLLRDGRAYIQFRHLADALIADWEELNRGRKIVYGPGVQVQGKRASAPTYRVPNGRIVVEEGSRTAQVAARSIALPAAPFRAGGVLYVPLAPLMEAMGGKALVNTKTHRFFLDFGAVG